MAQRERGEQLHYPCQVAFVIGVVVVMQPQIRDDHRRRVESPVEQRRSLTPR